jgi:hypothetical protein
MNGKKKVFTALLVSLLVFSSVFGAVYYSDVGEFLRLSRAVSNSSIYGDVQSMYATSSQFQLNGCGDETVLDKVTNICWEQNWSGFKGSGFDHDADGAVNWSQAVAYCDNLTLGTRSDWTLPTVKELRRFIPEHLYNYYNDVANQYIEDLGFVDTHPGGLYWAKTENNNIDSNNRAWYVNLIDGYDSNNLQAFDSFRAVCSVRNS